MKYLTLFYIFLYVTHITLGPYYLWYLLQGKRPKWMTKNSNELFKRSIWITYIGFLLIALFNEYPNAETFSIAFIISLLASFGYIYKFIGSEVFSKGVIDHMIIMILPLPILFFHYKIKLTTYKPTILTAFAVLYVLFIKYGDHFLYKTGINV